MPEPKRVPLIREAKFRQAATLMNQELVARCEWFLERVDESDEPWDEFEEEIEATRSLVHRAHVAERDRARSRAFADARKLRK